MQMIYSQWCLLSINNRNMTINLIEWCTILIVTTSMKILTLEQQESSEMQPILQSDIKFTVDPLSSNDNGRIPVLDLTIWVSEGCIEYSFYKKRVSSIFTILKRSAVTMKTTLDTIFQEALRRLYNVSPRLPWRKELQSLQVHPNLGHIQIQ